MTDILRELVGERCAIRTEDAQYLTGSPDVLCHVTGMDEEWLRVGYMDSYGNRITRLCRLDSLLDVTVFEE